MRTRDRASRTGENAPKPGVFRTTCCRRRRRRRTGEEFERCPNCSRITFWTWTAKLPAPYRRLTLAERRKRDLRAAELRAGGLTVAAIAAELGVGLRSAYTILGRSAPK